LQFLRQLPVESKKINNKNDVEYLSIKTDCLLDKPKFCSELQNPGLESQAKESVINQSLFGHIKNYTSS